MADSYAKLISEGFTFVTGGDTEQFVEGTLPINTSDAAVNMGDVGTAFVVEIINDETAAGRDMKVSFNGTTKKTTIKAGESTTFDKLAKIRSIYLNNGSGATTVAYRIRIYGVTG